MIDSSNSGSALNLAGTAQVAVTLLAEDIEDIDTGSIGINGASTDATNKLAINSAASLFNHDGNGHQIKLNKAAAGDTASVLYQTGFSGRAEFGTTGDDDFHVKVSPDGSTWFEAILADKDTGKVSFPNGVVDRTIYDVTDYGAVGDGITDDTSGILAAITAAGSDAVVYLPAGTYLVSGANSNAFELTASHNNISIRGAGRGTTIIKPVTNTVEVFAQNGAANVTIEDITFDNSANGVLDNQPKYVTEPNTPPSGSNTWGNGINAAIRQYEGDGLTVRRCEFIELNTCVHYIGDASDNSVTIGHLAVIDNIMTDCAFPCLADAATSIEFASNRTSGTLVSTNFDTSTDPGHAIYVTDRGAGYPKSVIVTNNYDTGGVSSAYKVRKGDNVVIANNTVHKSQRGIEFFGNGDATIQAVIANNAIILETIDATDTNPSGVELTDASYCIVANNVIDLDNSPGWGVRMRADNASAAQNVSNVVTGNVLQQDFDSVTGKAFIICTDQKRCVISDNTFRNIGTTANTRYPIDVRDTDGGRFENNRHICTNTPSDDDNILELDSGCTDCNVIIRSSDAEGVTLTGSVSDSGAGTTIWLNGVVTGTFTPTVTFSTAGDLSPTYATQEGVYFDHGNYVEIVGFVDFDTNAYTTATGEVRIGGLPFSASSAVSETVVALGRVGNITYAGELVGVIPDGANYFLLQGEQ